MRPCNSESACLSVMATKRKTSLLRDANEPDPAWRPLSGLLVQRFVRTWGVEVVVWSTLPS